MSDEIFLKSSFSDKWPDQTPLCANVLHWTWSVRNWQIIKLKCSHYVIGRPYLKIAADGWHITFLLLAFHMTILWWMIFTSQFSTSYLGEFGNIVMFQLMTSGLWWWERIHFSYLSFPEGWDVDEPAKDGINPEVLISLTAPKKCATGFSGKHFLAGRFLPYDIQKKYELNLPEFPGTECVIEL